MYEYFQDTAVQTASASYIIPRTSYTSSKCIQYSSAHTVLQVLVFQVHCCYCCAATAVFITSLTFLSTNARSFSLPSETLRLPRHPEYRWETKPAYRHDVIHYMMMDYNKKSIIELQNISLICYALALLLNLDRAITIETVVSNTNHFCNKATTTNTLLFCSTLPVSHAPYCCSYHITSAMTRGWFHILTTCPRTKHSTTMRMI